MDTVNNLEQTSIAFINDKSPILDMTYRTSVNM